MKLYRITIEDSNDEYPYNIINDLGINDYKEFDNFTDSDLVDMFDTYIKTLSDNWGYPIIERYKNGKSYEEIAKDYIGDDVNEIVKALKQRVKNGLTRIRKMFENDFVKQDVFGNGRIIDLKINNHIKTTLFILCTNSRNLNPNLTIEDVLRKFPTQEKLISAGENYYNKNREYIGRSVITDYMLKEIVEAFRHAGYNYPKR